MSALTGLNGLVKPLSLASKLRKWTPCSRSPLYSTWCLNQHLCNRLYRPGVWVMFYNEDLDQPDGGVQHDWARTWQPHYHRCEEVFGIPSMEDWRTLIIRELIMMKDNLSYNKIGDFIDHIIFFLKIASPGHPLVNWFSPWPPRFSTHTCQKLS